MTKFYLALILIIFTINHSSAVEGQCYFEEVYKNGSTQNGLLLISDNQIRYEYFDERLFTIIYSNNTFYLVKNSVKDQFEKIDDSRKDIFKNLTDIIYKYPNIENQFEIDGNNIEVDKSLNNDYPKRISIKSSRVNLSIYLFDCLSKPINKLFFKINPLFEYFR